MKKLFCSLLLLLSGIHSPAFAQEQLPILSAEQIAELAGKQSGVPILEGAGKAPEETAIPSRSTTSTPPILVADVSIYDAQIDNQEGRRLDISFVLANGGMAQPDIRYGLEFYRLNEEGQASLVASHVFPDVLELGADARIEKKIVYEVPAYLKGVFDAHLVSSNSSGMPIGVSGLGALEFSRTAESVEISNEDCYLRLAGDADSRYSLQEGVDILPAEELELVCVYSNGFKEDIELIPGYRVYERNVFGKAVEASGGTTEPVLAKAGYTAISAFGLPKPKDPQAYDLVFFFNDKQGNTVSNEIIAHFVIHGESATIQNLRLDREWYKKGEIAAVSFNWSGPASDFPFSRHGRTDVGELGYDISIKDHDGNVCAEKSELLDMEKIKVDLALAIQRDCADAVVGVSINKKDGSVLDSREYRFDGDDSAFPTKDSENKKTLLTILFLSMIIALAFLVFLFLRSKKKMTMLLMAGVMVFVGSIIFGTDSVEAATYYAYYGLKSPHESSYTWHGVYLNYNINKTTLNPGESMTSGIRMYSYDCANSLIDYSLSTSFNGGQSYQNISFSQPTISLSKGVESTPGAYNASFMFRDNRGYPWYGSCTYNKDIYLYNKAKWLNYIGTYGSGWTPSSVESAILSAGQTVYGNYINFGRSGCSVGPCEGLSACKGQSTGNDWVNLYLEYKVTTPAINGSCGTRSGQNYTYNTNSWPGGTFCGSSLSPSPANPAFPAQGATTYWDCPGSGGGSTAYNCSASRQSPPAPIPGDCGSRDATYAASISNWPGGSNWCDSSAAATNFLPNANFPAQGAQITWRCPGQNGGNPADCTAKRDNGCGTLPAHAVSYGFAEESSVPIGKVWTYNTSNSSEKCEYYCAAGYYYDGTNCVQVINGACGTRDGQTYPYDTVSWPAGTFCASGSTDPLNPAFPSQGATSNWICKASGGADDSCSASRDNPPAPVAGECGSRNDSYAVTVNNWPAGTDWCASGFSASPRSPNSSFPSVGGQVTWQCYGKYSGSDTDCQAIRYADCEGSIGPGAEEYDPEESVGVGLGVSWTYASTDSPLVKCQYHCSPGYNRFSGTCVADGACGPRAQKYPNSIHDWPDDQFCSAGTADPASPLFPASGRSVDWKCRGGSIEASCSASRSTGVGWEEVNPQQ